jgi:hypothetical protein
MMAGKESNLCGDALRVQKKVLFGYSSLSASRWIEEKYAGTGGL